MASRKTKYTIYFYIQNPNTQIHKDTLRCQDCEKKEEFIFFNYDSKQTTESIKDYFLSFFGHKYQCCICQLILCNKDEKFTILEKSNLDRLGLSKLYLIQKNSDCQCQLKDYIKNYYKQYKYQLIEEILHWNNALQYSTNINRRITKIYEKDNLKDDDFYDVVIDIK